MSYDASSDDIQFESVMSIQRKDNIQYGDCLTELTVFLLVNFKAF